MNKKSIIITIKKEIRSIIRDKKTFLTLLVFPILIPTMIFLYAYMYNDSTKEEYYNIGINYNPNTTEKSLLNQSYLKPKQYKSITEMAKDYKDKKISAYIDYNENKKDYTIYLNTDSQEGMYVSSYITSYLESYNTYLAKLYVTSEDVDIDKAYNNFTYKTENLKGENFILEMIFSISFTYIIMSIVLASTNMATSATAVEKENGTLETLLTFPIKASELITGKYLACVIISFLSSLIGLFLTIISIIIASHSFEIFNSINNTCFTIIFIWNIYICKIRNWKVL